MNCGFLLKFAGLTVIAFVLYGCGPTPGNDANDFPTSSSDTGQMIFQQRCASCHQTDGSGLPGASPTLVGSSKVNGAKAPLIATVLLGMKGPQLDKGVSYNGIMPSWKDVLTPYDLAKVLTFLRSSWGNSSSEISGDEVDQIRLKVDELPLFPSPAEIEELGKYLDSVNAKKR